MKSFQTNEKKKIFIQANCQGAALKNIFKKVSRLNEKYEIISVKPVHLWKEEDKEDILQGIQECDFFLHQPIFEKNFGIFASDNLIKHLKEGSRIVSFPNMYFTGYHPQAYYLKDDNGKKVSEPFEYHDKNIVEFYSQGLSEKDILNKIEDELFYSEEEIKKNIYESLSQLQEREKFTDIKISDYISENMFGTKLFHIFNHPTNEMIFYLFDHVLEHLEEEKLSIDEQKIFRVELLGAIRYPVYPALQRYFKLSGDLTVFINKSEKRNFQGIVKVYLGSYKNLKFLRTKEKQFNLREMLLDTQLSNAAEYISIAKYLLNNKETDLAVEVLKTASGLFPANKMLNNLLTSIGAEKGFVANKRKVFVIGLSRTATHSLAVALKELGYSSAHWTNPESGEILNWNDIYEYDALSDTPISFIFESLYYAFPDACFIYTTRDREAWVKSMDNHFKWANGFEGFKKISMEEPVPGKGLVKDPLWKLIHRNLYTMCNSWSDAYDHYDKRVKTFFKDKKGSNLLEIDLTTSDSNAKKWGVLAGFLNIETHPLKPFPRKNIRLQNLSDNVEADDLKEVIKQGEKIKINISQVISESRLEGYKYYTIPSDKPLKIDVPLHNYDHYIFKENEFGRPKTRVFSLDNVYLSLDFSKAYRVDYYIFNYNKKQITEFSNGVNPFLLNSVEHIDESIGFIDDKFTKFNVCHFILDKLTRIEELVDSDSSSFLVLQQNNYTKLFFNLLKVKYLDLNLYESKMVNNKITFKIKKLNISSSSSRMFRHPGQNINSNARNIIEKIKSTIPVTEKKHKVYIDRSISKTRHTINEEEVKGYLLSKGFVFAKLENMTIDEQLTLFRNATCIVGTHGAGLTNIAFCEPGTKVVEILPPLCATQAFWKLAKAMDLNYDTILATDPDYDIPNYKYWKHDPSKYNQRDIAVSLDDLKCIV